MSRIILYEGQWGLELTGSIDYIFICPKLEVLDTALTSIHCSEDGPNLFPPDHSGIVGRLRVQ